MLNRAVGSLERTRIVRAEMRELDQFGEKHTVLLIKRQSVLKLGISQMR